MKISKVILISTLAMATIWGCKKDEPANTPVPNPTSSNPSFQTLFADNIANATQTFSMNAASGGQVMGVKGTQLLFEPGAFVFANGTPVTGQVQVSLVEALTMGDMIMLNKQTVGNDNGTLRILRSGGAINVYAAQGGTPVRITQGGLIAKIPTNVGDPSMELFTGNENANGDMIWDPIDSSMLTVDPAYYDSTDYTYTFPYYFYYDIDGNTELNWLNCDYWWNAPNTTPLVATIPAGQSSDSTRVWLALPAGNSVTALGLTGSQTYGYPYVPIGTQAVIIGLKENATGYSSSFNPITVTNGIVVPMTFTPTTLAQFEVDVNAL